jgi:hypothetical protein
MPCISPNDRFGSEADFARERLLKGESQKKLMAKNQRPGSCHRLVASYSGEVSIPIHVFSGKELL